MVVWYDERSEFVAFVAELRNQVSRVTNQERSESGGQGSKNGAAEVVLTPDARHLTPVLLAEYAGSMVELRATVEPHASGDAPTPIVVYMPGCTRDRRASVLMELERAGTTWEPQLKQLAKNVLLQKYTLGVVDEMLPFNRKVSYQDLARVTAGSAGSEPPSILKSIFHDTSGNTATWLEAYTSKDGWYRLDAAQRRLEAWVANLDEEPEERRGV